ncbi:MAG TPA: hypothetical protein VHS27_04565 [Gaiellales bacterium]|nr:hypothetical protein [Gaiellales bacterium]
MAATVEDASLVWADVLGSASLNKRIVARYLAVMVAAGVIAGYGVVDNTGAAVVFTPLILLYQGRTYYVFRTRLGGGVTSTAPPSGSPLEPSSHA